MRRFIPVLAAVVIGTTGMSSATRAATIDFDVATLGGSITFIGGSTLDNSSTLDLDSTLLIVTNLGSNDDSGLSVFPGGIDNTVTLPGSIDYGSGMGPMNTPVDIVESWTGLINGVSDTFTETLLKVTDIDRNTPDTIKVTLTGSVSDSLNLFTKTPAQLVLTASESGDIIGAMLTNRASSVSNVPETSTWVMMALGFVGLGYAAVRRSSKDRSALAV